jgi:alkanesulfonate monooxygenase SsuD/methylene tetrahydromethanopterin reductase-like flavin-dependent oxidoreductase (luciferase family)
MSGSSERNAPLFGINIDPSATNRELAFHLAKLADSTNLDLIGIQDHPYNPAFLDTWTLLTALGAVTERVHLLPNVLNLSLRPPAMLAKAAASLDVLTQGRVELGLGAGAWGYRFNDGMLSYGAPDRTPGEAVSALEEALHLVRTLWEAVEPNQMVSFEGTYYQLHNARPGPAPVHNTRIWLGSLKPRMLRLAGQLADGLLISNTYIPPEEVLTKQKIVDDAAEKMGRKPNVIRRGYNVMGSIQSVGSRTVTAERKGLFIGTPKEWTDELLRYYNDLRLDTFIVWPVMGNEERQTRVFAEEIVPAVKEALDQQTYRG